MKYEEEIFKKSKVNLDKLIPYGFIKDKKKYIFTKNILDDMFQIYIEIINNNVIGKIYDLSFNEEYINYRLENQNGKFNNNIRNTYINTLIDIRDNCFQTEYFKTSQANRIAKFINKEYNDIPKFLWDKYPTDGVFKNPNNNKWYGLIMSIPKYKIDEGNNEIEILNLKLDENKINTLLKKKGFYKAYHMNKQKWITIILDDSIKDKEIINYIKESHKFTEY